MMSNWQLQTPVAFILFKRPDTTEKVFAAIRQAKPPKLLVIADGPRPDKPGEAEKCAAARSIIERVDWDCEVLKNYSETNLGCKYRVSSGLDWVFEQVEEAIILEDDCLPDPSFFRFCEELLEKYRDDERVMKICGTNKQGTWKSDFQSYHFSYYGGCWGWASWKRAWSHYDVEMKLWSQSEIKQRIRDVLADEKQYRVRQQRFDSMYFGKVDSWDAQWLFTCLLQSGLSIIPSVNLIRNLGFGSEATHTTSTNNRFANVPLLSMNFPLEEPLSMTVDREYDHRFCQETFPERSWLRNKMATAKRIINSNMA